MGKLREKVLDSRRDERFVVAGGEKRRMVILFERGGRCGVEFDMVGEGGELELLMVFVGSSAARKLELRVQVNHLAARTSARVTLKAVLRGRSSVEFVGGVFAGAEAHGTDSFLKCEALLLSDGAFAKMVPSMEIIADDVKAGHAAAVGGLDEESLFYLESRGLDRKRAEKMMVEGFLGELRENGGFGEGVSWESWDGGLGKSAKSGARVAKLQF